MFRTGFETGGKREETSLTTSNDLCRGVMPKKLEDLQTAMKPLQTLIEMKIGAGGGTRTHTTF
jgi:hypothetical protein